MSPLVGLSVYREQASWGVWEQSADLLPANYSQWVVAAGGTPLLLPPGGDPAAVVGVLDVLVICGGADVDPARYAAEPHERTANWRPDRDAWELALLDAAPPELPVLGICRGMQMMAVHAGGSLHQHVPDRVGHDQHSPAPTVFSPVPVTTVPGTRVAAILGDSVTSSCHHHQSVATHPGFTAAAHSADGSLEAMEAPNRLAVQWHPETTDDVRLLQALLARPVNKFQ